MRKSKKLLSAILAVCMLFSIAVIPNTISAAAEDYNLADSVQDGVILHAWNWSFNTIKENLPEIAKSGYTTIQTSPLQHHKDFSATNINVAGQWWKLYQPISFKIADTGSHIGTKAELTALCAEAKKYGIKIIVDIVANHLANNAADVPATLNADIQAHEPTIYNAGTSSQYFHQVTAGISDTSLQNTVQGVLSNMRSLNTGNAYVQDRVIALLKDCIDAGVEGFRFDAAKHIETPSDGTYASNFWTRVLGEATSYAQAQKSITPYYYGEILNNPGTGRSYSHYTSFMSFTDNVTGNSIRSNVEKANASAAATSTYSSGAAANKIVLWAESHDTYQSPDASGSEKSRDTTNANIVKTWALVGSRKDATALYFARPKDGIMGHSGDTTWKSLTVAEINKFHNAYVGQSETLGSTGSVAYVARGNSGIVLVNVAASGATTLNSVQVNGIADGSYIDTVTGNSFTVSGGKISGIIGASGVAVVYATKTTPFVQSSVESTTFKTDYLKVNLSYQNANYGTFKINNGTEYVITGGNYDLYIGSGDAANTSYELTLTATDGTKTVTSVYKYKKVENNDSDVWVVYNKSVSTGNYEVPLCYIYDKDAPNYTESNGAWPGLPMEYHPEINPNYYIINVPQSLVDKGCMAIFNEGNGRSTNPPQYPVDGSKLKLNITNKSMISNSQVEAGWVAYTGEVPGEQPSVPTTVLEPVTQDTTPNPTTTPAPPTTTPAPPTTTTTPITTTAGPTVTIDPKSEGDYVLGDVTLKSIIIDHKISGVAKVDINDATLIQKDLAKLTGEYLPLSGLNALAADCNQSGAPDISDVTAIQKYLAKLVIPEQVGKIVCVHEEPQPTTEDDSSKATTTIPVTTSSVPVTSSSEPVTTTVPVTTIPGNTKTFYVVDNPGWALADAKALWIRDNDTGTWYVGTNFPDGDSPRCAIFDLDESVNNISIYSAMGSYVGGPATGEEMEALYTTDTEHDFVYDAWTNITIGSNAAYAITGSSAYVGTGELKAIYDPNEVPDSIPLVLYFIKPDAWSDLYIYGWGNSGLGNTFHPCELVEGNLYKFDFSAFTSSIPPNTDCFKFTAGPVWDDKQTDDIAGELGMNTLTIEWGMKGTWSYVNYGGGTPTSSTEATTPTETTTTGGGTPDPDTRTFYFYTTMDWVGDGVYIKVEDVTTGIRYELNPVRTTAPFIWTADLPDTVTSIAFLRLDALDEHVVNSWTATVNTTSDQLSLLDDGVETSVEKPNEWGTYQPITDVPMLMTVYFDNSATNWSTVYIYSWSSAVIEGASGSSQICTPMTRIGSTNIWKYDMAVGLVVGAQGYLFKNTAGNTSWDKQSTNPTTATNSGGDICNLWIGADGAGSWSQTIFSE